ncbi:hypothetical protein FACS189419_04380 [Planctomycetales bacterium]|nr:hypothetical protein FACS189419_04380 [Planctomycetales bacterium]
MDKTGSQHSRNLLCIIIIGIGGVIAGLVFYYMLLYTLWKQIPPDIAQTTPGKGIGFLFIPFFNLYWQFIAIWGLGQDVNKTIRKTGTS